MNLIASLLLVAGIHLAPFLIASNTIWVHFKFYFLAFDA